MEQDSKEVGTESTEEAEAPAGNIKETIESILVAFILAFVFRAFVVEAFVIPTGSMAPTLLGAHMRYTCPDCGYRFDFNVSGTESGDDVDIPSTASPPWKIYCPNCGDLVAGPSSPQQAVHYGDRILVLKYAYLLQEPQRWDVVVFKSPASPAKYHYAQNYIKRLVGRPGEQVMVLDGDLYIRTSDDADWEIQTKPRSVQDALWRVVYDNDYHPIMEHRAGQADWKQPWKSLTGAGWNDDDLKHSRVFHFDNMNASGEIAFDPKANSTTQTFNDYLVYDADPFHGMARQPGATSAPGSPDDDHFDTVSDLKLAAYYQRLGGDGIFRLKLSRFEKVDHTFTAEVTPDAVRLMHTSEGKTTQLGPEVKLADLGLDGKSPMLVELLNVDYKVTLRINDKEVATSSHDDYKPDVPWLIARWHDRTARLPEASIEAEKQSATITHVGLWRDIYYTNRESALISGMPPDPSRPDRYPTRLGPHEYFVLGDNSLVSADARYWSDAIDLPHEDLKVPEGRVPEQFLLGKAIFVYWPAGYRPFDPTGWAVIPNFGDMRWIH